MFNSRTTSKSFEPTADFYGLGSKEIMPKH